MSQMPGTSPSTSDAATELAMSAMASERANRPRHYIIGAGVLLAVALGYLLWVVSTRGAAAARLNSTRNQLTNINKLVTALKESYDAGSAKLYEPDRSKITNRLQTIAEGMGLADVRPATSGNDSRPAGVKGYVYKQYSVMLNDKSATQIFTYLQKCITDGEIPGLDIYRLKLTPASFKLPSGEVAWNADVGFKRWQRDE